MTTEIIEHDDESMMTQDSYDKKRDVKLKEKDIYWDTFEGNDGKEWKSIYCYCWGRMNDDVTIECIGSRYVWCEHGGIFHWKCV